MRFTKLIIFGVAVFVLSSFLEPIQENRWIAPPTADTLTNPLNGNASAVTDGKKLYDKHCWQCHGTGGKGDGPGAKNLNPKPADHTSVTVQEQSDGAIFWKVSKGRGAMQPYERTLNKTQRWQLVEYIRSLAPVK